MQYRIRALFPALVILCAAVLPCVPGCTTEKTAEPTGTALSESLAPWDCYIAEPGVTRDDVWKLENGILVCRGTPLGYLYTKKKYTDFQLTLEWRWPPGGVPGKGGVLIRMTGEHRIWPRSLEAQLNVGEAGDFWGLGGYGLAGPAERWKSFQHDQFGDLTNLSKLENREKPAGEWNTYEIVAEGGTVTLRINGTEVNEAGGCAAVAGPICLTAEGSEIHFRNIRLISLEAEQRAIDR